VYYALSFDLEYKGAQVLALDPWMVFQKHTDSSLTLERVQNNGRGLLLLPGREREARLAWIARLLQEGDGKFPEDPALWLEAENGLFDGNLFPADAPAVNWTNVLSRLLSSEPAWLYAPLSVIRGYSSEARASILEAVAFPENAPGGQFSLQAKLLWAIPSGTDKQKEELQETITWLKDPGTQTVIADELRWIPAVPYGKPYNPVSMTSYLAWLTTAYIYEIPVYETP
jgi:ABC-type glycerol-3-phosphate transport system substrate-binding protein